MCEAFNPAELPQAGLILVFGGIGSGKDTAIIDPIIAFMRRMGRPVHVIQDEPSIQHPLMLNDGKVPVVVIRNGHRIFGPPPDLARNEPDLLQDTIVSMIEQRAPLIVIAFQAVSSISDSWREELLAKARAEIILATSDQRTVEHVRLRKIVKLRYFEDDVPLPHTFKVKKTWTGGYKGRVIQSTRAMPTTPWRTSVRRFHVRSR